LPAPTPLNLGGGGGLDRGLDPDPELETTTRIVELPGIEFMLPVIVTVNESVSWEFILAEYNKLVSFIVACPDCGGEASCSRSMATPFGELDKSLFRRKSNSQLPLPSILKDQLTRSDFSR
jgi:hypothetical protein